MPVIGREFPADIVIAQPQVSARHAHIRHIEGERYVVADLRSTNGTFVNGKRIRIAVIRPQDRLSLGSYALTLSSLLHLVPRSDGVTG